MLRATKRYCLSTLLSCCVLCAFICAGATIHAQNYFNITPNAPATTTAGQNSSSLAQIPSLPSPSDTAIQPLSSARLDGGADLHLVAQDDIAERIAELTSEEQIAVQLYATRNKSVVNVSTLETHRSFFSHEVAEGCGSGVVLNQQGVILTNFHVVENTSRITVTLFNGETYEAKPIGVDPNTDVAIIKINAPAEHLFPVEFGDSSKLLVGQTVYAIGNPFGLERTMTKGIVSNLNRSIDSPQQFRQIKGVIQIDAAINPGNSGGALFDTKGRMIGMNTAIASHVGESSGVGFAVPVNTIHRIVTILIERGEVVRGDAGVVQVTETDEGLIPALIDEGGAADMAGLRGGKLVISVMERNGMRYQTRKQIRPEGGFDLIAGVNGQPVKTGEEFITAVEEHEPGETITLNVRRNGRPIELQLILK